MDPPPRLLFRCHHTVEGWRQAKFTTSNDGPAPNDPRIPNCQRNALCLLEFCGVFFVVFAGLEERDGGLLRFSGCTDAVHMADWIYVLVRRSL